MSVITQDGDSALMIASWDGRIEVVSLLLKAGANTDLQDKVKCVQEDEVLGREHIGNERRQDRNEMQYMLHIRFSHHECCDILGVHDTIPMLLLPGVPVSNTVAM